MNIINKIKYLLTIPFVYKNFWLGYFSMFSLLNGKKTYLYKLRNELKFHTTGSKWSFFILNEIFISKEYDISLEKDPKTIVDIGANIGAASLFFCKKYRGSIIHSIKPFEKNFIFLEKNVKENNFSKNIKTYNIAIGKNNKKGKLFLNKENDGCHSILSNFNIGGKEVKIQIYPFDTFLKENKIDCVDLLKMDCEGAELQIINSINNFSKIKNIIMEFTYPYLEKIKRKLEKNGFKIILEKDRPLLFAHK